MHLWDTLPLEIQCIIHTLCHKLRMTELMTDLHHRFHTSKFERVGTNQIYWSKSFYQAALHIAEIEYHLEEPRSLSHTSLIRGIQLRDELGRVQSFLIECNMLPAELCMYNYVYDGFRHKVSYATLLHIEQSDPNATFECLSRVYSAMRIEK